METLREFIATLLENDPLDAVDSDSAPDMNVLIPGQESYDHTMPHPVTGIPVRVMSMGLLRAYLEYEGKDMDWFRSLPNVQQARTRPGFEWLREVFHATD